MKVLFIADDCVISVGILSLFILFTDEPNLFKTSPWSLEGVHILQATWLRRSGTSFLKQSTSSGKAYQENEPLNCKSWSAWRFSLCCTISIAGVYSGTLMYCSSFYRVVCKEALRNYNSLSNPAADAPEEQLNELEEVFKKATKTDTPAEVLNFLMHIC